MVDQERVYSDEYILDLAINEKFIAYLFPRFKIQSFLSRLRLFRYFVEFSKCVKSCYMCYEKRKKCSVWIPFIGFS